MLQFVNLVNKFLFIFFIIFQTVVAAPKAMLFNTDVFTTNAVNSFT